ncbi:hypothetical protein V6N12_047338 [Hibiscus sabdariffa]|uniref:Uncharacterized protein n=1 Tax=Hibiscus sabdariffa TaxID=183260 RepID=A0ABR2DAL0_9ROSI
MDVADAIPIQVAMPTPPASEQAEPSTPAGAQPSPAATPQATPTNNPTNIQAATSEQQESGAATPDTPLGTATPSPPPSPAQPKEAAPLYILQLRNQLQRVEARQLQFMEETKTTAQPSDGVGNTEQVHYSSNDENDVFDWHTPLEHQASPRHLPAARDIPESSTAKKGKAPVHTEG